MTRFLKLVGVALLTAVFWTTPNTIAQEDPSGRLAIVKSQFEVLRENAFSEQKEFEEKYAAELEKLKEKTISAGDLVLVLAGKPD